MFVKNKECGGRGEANCLTKSENISKQIHNIWPDTVIAWLCCVCLCTCCCLPTMKRLSRSFLQSSHHISFCTWTATKTCKQMEATYQRLKHISWHAMCRLHVSMGGAWYIILQWMSNHGDQSQPSSSNKRSSHRTMELRSKVAFKIKHLHTQRRRPTIEDNIYFIINSCGKNIDFIQNLLLS